MSSIVACDNTKWFIFNKDQLLLNQNDHLPCAKTITSLEKFLTRQLFIGEFNQANCYCAELEHEINLPHEFKLIPLKKAFEVLGLTWYVPTAKAFSIINWDKNHRFCGRCSSATLHKLGSFERICNMCHAVFYPRISPSIIVLIRKNNEVLMARSPHFSPGVYGLIAGFVEIGESVEEAVFREVKEEVGIEITNLRYFGSQSWPFPDSLMIGFFADYASGEIHIDGNEIIEAGWYRYDQLPGRPSSKMSIAGKLLDQFIAENSNKDVTAI